MINPETPSQTPSQDEEAVERANLQALRDWKAVSEFWAARMKAAGLIRAAIVIEGMLKTLNVD